MPSPGPPRPLESRTAPDGGHADRKPGDRAGSRSGVSPGNASSARWHSTGPAPPTRSLSAVVAYLLFLSGLPVSSALRGGHEDGVTCYPTTSTPIERAVPAMIF